MNSSPWSGYTLYTTACVLCVLPTSRLRVEDLDEKADLLRARRNSGYDQTLLFYHMLHTLPFLFSFQKYELPIFSGS